MIKHRLHLSRRELFIVALMLVLVAGVAAANSNYPPPAKVSISKLSGPSIAGAGAAANPINTTAGWTGSVSLNHPTVIHATHSDVSPPLRDIKPAPQAQKPPVGDQNETDIRGIKNHVPPFFRVDTVVQNFFGPLVMPTPILTFEGYGQQDNFNLHNGLGVLPPDNDGDVGPNHYVEWVNIGIKMFDKSGNTVFGPVLGNTLWSGFTGTCAVDNNGDPIVQYDQLADRWLLSQFSIPSSTSGPTYECIAISTTGDPTGSYYRYEFQTHPAYFEDYPHFGVWPDAYYMATNEFDSPVTLAGAGNFAFDRAKMLAGDPGATMQYFHLDAPYSGFLPSDLDGSALPPAGSPNYFITFDDDAGGAPQDQLTIFQFHVDWVNSANSTFTGPTSLATAPFDSELCTASRGACVPQPGTTVQLEDLSDRLMYRLAYRNYGDHESLVVNHTVDANGAGLGGVRWYELRKVGSNMSIYQQSTYAPDSTTRWMGSIAMDHDGNMAMGYSVSSNVVFPSLRYAGRLSTDPLGQMAQGEGTLYNGGGSQTNSDSPRWGDYSFLAVDPVDDCTFWYVNEYYARTSSGTWQTRIGSFKFPLCGVGTATPTATGTPPTATPTGTPTGTATATATPVCVLNYQSTDVPKPIIDTLTITSSLTVNNGPVIASIEVTNIGITHTYPSDLNVVLISPANTRVQLFGDICGGDPDWTPANTGFTLSDGASVDIGDACPPGNASYRPFNPLAALIGQSSSGTWTLEITDGFLQDQGMLASWGLRIGSAAPCPTGTATRTPTRTVTPIVGASLLVGHVTWQGRPAQPNVLQQLPITLTLKSLATEVNYPVQATDASGFFTVNVSSLLPGTYNWRTKSAQVGASPPDYNPGWLATSGSVVLTGVPVTNQEMGLQRAGDCNNDNVVNSTDFVIMKNTFGRAFGEAQYDNRADITGDHVINVTDFNPLRTNFGQGGAPPVSPR